MRGVYYITDYGALPDGRSNTAQIKAAIDACREGGGGTVVIPAGIFISGGLRLYSDITLRLDSGAVLKSSTRPEDFPPVGFKHNEMGEVTSLICALNEKNIEICGAGCIDLSSELLYPGNEQGDLFADALFSVRLSGEREFGESARSG